jgi:predicted Zn-dependent protease
MSIPLQPGWRSALILPLALLAGCQTAPVSPPGAGSLPPAATAPVLPQTQPEQRPQHERLPTAPPPRRILRLPAVLQPRAAAPLDGQNVPAVQQLIGQAKAQLQAGQLDTAEQTLRQLQRLAPENPALYAYLSELFLRRQQPDLAETAARRGLLYARSPAQQKAFWQLVLLAAQQQQDAHKTAEAQRQMAQLP